jgi:hypothetical protein
VQATNLEVQLSDCLGDSHRVRVVNADDLGWRLHATIRGTPFSKRCHDWQSVERTLSWLRRHAHEPLRKFSAAAEKRAAAQPRRLEAGG